MSNKPQAGATMSAPNVIPMADIMLVLLIIFMIVAPMLRNGFPGDLDMAKVPHPSDLPNADKEDAIIVAVARDGRIYLGSTQAAKDHLGDIVKDEVSNRVDKTVFIRSDSRAKYSDVAGVIDEVRNAGVDKVGLLTDRSDRAQRPN